MKDSKVKILAIGEIIWDIFAEKSVIGGAPLNFAAHASLCGAYSALLSAVGNDMLGDSAIETLKNFGVATKYIKKTEHPTGQCIVTLDENAIPSYNVLRDVAYDNIFVTDEDIVCINSEGFHALYFGTLIQRDIASRNAVRRIVDGCSFDEIICDVNLRPACYDEDSVLYCLSNATILKVSSEEEPLLRSLSGYIPLSESETDIAQALCRRFNNLKIVIITLGKDGSYTYDTRSGREYYQSAIGNKVVSTVGAGDSFAAAWVTCFLQGEKIETCMKKASELSGFVVAHTEAVPKY